MGFVGSPSTTIGAGKKGERVKYWKAGYFVGLKFMDHQKAYNDHVCIRKK